MLNVNDANISMKYSSCEFRKLFVIENSLARNAKTSRKFTSCEMKSNPENFVNKIQDAFYRAEFWLLMLIEVVNRFTIWVKGVSQ